MYDDRSTHCIAGQRMSIRDVVRLIPPHKLEGNDNRAVQAHGVKISLDWYEHTALLIMQLDKGFKLATFMKGIIKTPDDELVIKNRQKWKQLINSLKAEYPVMVRYENISLLSA